MAKVPLRAVVLSHVPFEDLGSLQPILEERGFTIETIDVPTAQFPLPEAQSCDLLIVMGGPIGVYDSDKYPFLTGEIETIRQRLVDQLPILGICLGAQLMAAALGARVYPGKNGAEIGWYPIRPAESKTTPVWFSPLFADGLKVFHWHGDTFDLPNGAERIASSDLYINQAFTVDKFALALQFHPEVTASRLERWYVGHACELQMKGISVADMREATRRNSPNLEEFARRFWNMWLNYIL